MPLRANARAAPKPLRREPADRATAWAPPAAAPGGPISAITARCRVIISSGLLLHAEMVAEELGIDPVLANEIGFDGDGDQARVNGRVTIHVPHGSKQPMLARWQADLGVTPAETLATGDTRSDLSLFNLAAVAVAVQPEHPEVTQAAHIVFPDGDLRPLLNQLHGVAPELWSAEGR